MGTQTQTVERSNVATPFAQDVIGLLRQQITGSSGAGGGPRVSATPRAPATSSPGVGGLAGVLERGREAGRAASRTLQSGGAPEVSTPGPAAFGGSAGMGLGPLQREAGTAMRQFVQSLQDRVGAAGDFQGREFDALRTIQEQNRERATANAAEQLGRAGNVAGSAQGFAQAQTMRELIPQQERVLAETRRAEEAQLLDAIGRLQTIGQQNIEPFLQLASAGIVNPEVTQREHPIVTGLGALSGAASGAGNLAGAI